MTLAAHSAQGRDVSDYQPVQSESSWNGYTFGITKATEAIGWRSLTAAANMAHMRQVQKVRPFYPGWYHFLHPGEDPIAQANHFVAFIKAAGLQRGDMLIVDSETLAGAARVTASPRNHVELSEASLNATPMVVDSVTKAFLDAVSVLVGAENHLLMPYTMHAVGQYLTETAAHYPHLWFAWPASSPPPPAMIAPWPSWLIWQWSFAGGNLGDLDAFDGAPGDLESFMARYLGQTSGPFRHLASGQMSLDALAGARNTTAAHIVSQTIEAQIPRVAAPVANGASAELGAFARYLDESDGSNPMPGGLVYYTTNP